MTRGEIYHSRHAAPERGSKGGYFVVVSRDGIAGNELIETVVCAPVYSTWRGLHSEVPLTREDGVEHDSSIRCDFLMLVFKRHLTRFSGTLGVAKMRELDRALAFAVGLPWRGPPRH